LLRVCWLARGFEVNLDVTLLTVYIVVKRDNLWTLLDISNTNQWKSWITEAKGRGEPFDIVVQFIQKPQVPAILEEQVQEEPEGAHEATADEDEEVDEERVVAEGLADEGERIASIVEQTEREDEEMVLVEIEGVDSDEDIGDAVPTEWRQRGFGEYAVADSWRNEWEYR
jgi:hypothetical protein